MSGRGAATTAPPRARTVLLTGAAGGIGSATARRLHRRGHRLALVDVDAGRLAALAGELGGDTLALPCDTADLRALSDAAEQAVARLGGIDVVIANAGIARFAMLRHTTPEDFDAVVRTNLYGTYTTLHVTLPQLIERRGYVLVVASLAALVPPIGLGAYAASKAGVEQLARVLRLEVAHHGVDVGVAYFSWVGTPMVTGFQDAHPGYARMRAGLRWPVARTIPVARAADAIVDGVERRRHVVTAPRVIGALRLARGMLGRIVDRQLRPMVAEVDARSAGVPSEPRR